MTRALTIGFVLDDSLDSTDGVQQYVLTLGAWLTEQGHTVHYLVGETARTDIPNVHSLSRNVRVSFNKNRLSVPRFANKAKIKQLFGDVSFDILHVQMPFSPMLAARVIDAAPATTRVIGTFHILPAGGLQTVATRVLGSIVRRSIKRFDDVISVSEPARVFSNKTLGVSSVVIPNAVNVSAMKTKKPRKNNLHTIVFLGRLVERKGAGHLLAAFAQMPRRDAARLIIGGKGPLLAKLKAQAANLGIAERVEFAGFVSEEQKPSFLAQADLAVFPSTGGESFGIILVEAMAAGAGVVIAGDNPGYRTVMHERHEVLVQPDDHRLFAEHMAELLRDQTLADELHDWQQGLLAQFDVETVGPKIVERYRDALRSKS